MTLFSKRPYRLLTDTLLKVLPISIVLAVAFWLIIRVFALDIFKKEMNEHLNTQVLYATSSISQKFNTIIDTATALANSEIIKAAIINYTTDGSNAYLSMFIKSIPLIGANEATLSLIDNKGQLIVTNGTTPNGTQGQTNMLEWVNAPASISDKGIKIAVKVFDKQLPIGFILIEYAPSYLINFLTVHIEHGFYFIIDKKSTVLYSSKPAVVQPGKVLSTLNDNAYVEVKKEFTGYNDLDGLVLISAVHEEVILKELRKLDIIIFCAMLFSLLVIVSATTATAKSIDISINGFIRRLRQIKTYEDLKKTINISAYTAAEIHMLANEFNDMMQKVEITTSELTQANEKLQAEIITRKQMEDQSRHTYEMQHVLNQVLSISLESIPLSEMLYKILHTVTSISWLSLQSKGAIFTIENEPKVLIMQAHYGMSSSIINKCRRVPFDMCLCGRAASKSVTFFVDCIDELHDVKYDGMEPHGHYCTPIVAGKKTIGVICLYVNEGHQRNSIEEEAISSIASTIAGIIERKKTEEELEALRQKNELILYAAGEGIYGVDVNGNTTFLNPAAAKMTGWSIEDLVGKAQHDIIHHTKLDGSRYPMSDCPIYNALKDGKVRHVDDEVFWKKDGSSFPVEYITTPMRDEMGNIVGSVVVFKDITERKQLEQRLRELAHFDQLTGLANRVLFFDRLNHAIAVAKRTNAKIALLFIDMNRFKYINDTLGHNVGDILLQEAAKRFNGVVRESDTVSRIGGDEFTITLTNVTKDTDGEYIAQRIIKALTAPFHIDSHELFVGASIGISIYPDDGTDIDILIKKADTAMYKAKLTKGSSYRFFNPEMEKEALERIAMEKDLRYALDKGEFQLFYQPIIDLNTNKIVSMEALLRWFRNGEAYVGPAEFIPLAEESGLIIPIGRWVLKNACIQAKKWHDEGFKNLNIAVNISMSQFIKQKDLGKMVAQILFETKLAPKYLELEITEDVCLQNIESTVSVLHEFDELGIGLSIDDFGTGYASLSYLKNLPIKKLKIDRSIISNIQDSEKDASIVSAIIAMSKSFELKTVAEGVETIEQLEMLRSLTCDEAQGFLLAKPLPAVQHTQTLAKTYKAS
ncbi:MAG: EAL domain-containing protein [Candidatus Magnetoovum sp. WYHC-5]|nr:EAL domain-containing protein [Candidatus Magnetoovum sp. WYHC-5]